MQNSELNDDKANDNAVLEIEAQMMLGTENLEGLKQWYLNALEPVWAYVVFIVRRSYLLALILEKITGRHMEENESVTFLTDASLLLQCREIANYYECNGVFPRILINDDILIHGRNINHLLGQMEKQIIAYLPEENAEDIKNALADAVDIRVYMRADAQLLLNSRYEFRLSYIRKGKQSVWRSLASNISELILRSNMANASYVFSEGLSAAEVSSIDSDKYIRTIYHGTEEQTYVQLVGDSYEKRAILTLRIMKGFGNSEYRAIPFVFMPNLTEEATDVLEKEILKRIEDQRYRQWLGELKQIWGKRSYNELLTLIFSNAILQEFNARYNIMARKRDRDEEIRKLARNYNLFGLETTEDLLSNLINLRLFKIDDLAQLLDKCIPDDFMVLQTGGWCDSSRQEILDGLEKYFYKYGYKEEMEAINLGKALHTNISQYAKRRARGCCFVLKELCTGYTETDAMNSIVYFLQMMDAGILGLSSYAPDNIMVVGMAQYAKAGEMALYLLPLKNYYYIPLLSEIQDECEQWGRSLVEGIRSYWKKLSLSHEEEIIQFVERLEQIGQTPMDWNDNYLSRIDFEGENRQDIFKKKVDFVKMQQNLLDRYTELKR